MTRREKPNPSHQPDTEFIGELHEFSGPVLPADDPSLAPRERKGRPNDKKPPNAEEK